MSYLNTKPKRCMLLAILVMMVCAWMALTRGPLTAQTGLAPGPIELELEARQASEDGLYDQAVPLLEDIVASYPATEAAFLARRDLIEISIRTDDDLNAQLATDQLIADYAGVLDLSGTVNALADCWRSAHKYAQAQDYYSYVVKTWPNSESALWSQMGLAISKTYLNDPNGADEAADRLLVGFAEDARIAVAGCLTADSLRACKRYEKACQVYDWVVQNRPELDHAMWCQMGIAVSRSYLNEGDLADQAINRLVVDFADNPRIPLAACLTADSLREQGLYGKAAQLYDYAVQTWPTAEHAMWSQMGLAISRSYLSDSDGADEAINLLVTNFAENPRIPLAACLTADSLRKQGLYHKAADVYDYVVQTWPTAEHALWCHMGKSIAQVAVHNDPNAPLPSPQQLVANYPTTDQLQVARFLTAECTFELALEALQSPSKDRARRLLELTVELAQNDQAEFANPSPEWVGYETDLLLAECYRHLERYPEAIAHYTRVAEIWSGYEYAWQAQFMIGECYRLMGPTEDMTPLEVTVRMRLAFLKLLEVYPDCPAAKAAYTRLYR